MNNDFEALQWAMASDIVQYLPALCSSNPCSRFSRCSLAHLKECSSVATFKGVCHILTVCAPHVFILENVDSLDSGSGAGEDSKELLP